MATEQEVWDEYMKLGAQGPLPTDYVPPRKDLVVSPLVYGGMLGGRIMDNAEFNTNNPWPISDELAASDGLCGMGSVYQSEEPQSFFDDSVIGGMPGMSGVGSEDEGEFVPAPSGPDAAKNAAIWQTAFGNQGGGLFPSPAPQSSPPLAPPSSAPTPQSAPPDPGVSPHSVPGTGPGGLSRNTWLLLGGAALAVVFFARK